MYDEIDWDAEATEMASHVREDLSEAHHGAIPWKQPGVSVAFGIDGYPEDRQAHSCVDWLTIILDALDIPVLGFGLDPEEEYTWAMLVRTEDRELLNGLVWLAWTASTDSLTRSALEFRAALEACRWGRLMTEVRVN